VVQKWEHDSARALIESMSNTHAEVRVAAIFALARLSRQADSQSGGSTSPMRKMIAKALPSNQRPFRQPPRELADALSNGTARWTRENAAAFHGFVDKAPPPALLTALDDPSAVVRVAAVEALGEFPLRIDVAIPTLLSMLEKDESEVRKACAQTLRIAWPTASVFSNLAESVRRGTTEARSLAIVLLGRIGPEAGSTVPDLIGILKEPLDTTIPRSALGGMQQDPPCCAARALGLIASSDEAIDALAATLASNCEYRHDAAAYGLVQIGDAARAAAPALVSAYNRWLDCKDQVLSGRWMTTAVGRLAPRSVAEADGVAALIRALDDKDRSIHLIAVAALGKFGKNAAAAIPKLRSLKDKDASVEIRDAASVALKAIETNAKLPNGQQNPA
jgi:HEAT repeat protein